MKCSHLALALALACLATVGCTPSQTSTVAPVIPQLAVPVITPPAPSAPTSAEEYLSVARRGGDSTIPRPGSSLRTRLMDSARDRLGLSCKFFVHSLVVNQEVANGTIEPYPQGTGQVQDVTWVLWRKQWTVVSVSKGIAPSPSAANSTGSGLIDGDATGDGGSGALFPSVPVTPSTGSGLSYGDANGDGDSGVLFPSVPSGANPSDSSTGQNTEWHWVDGYFRSDGTYVSGYYRRTE